MTLTLFNYTTGPACLPDVGALSYNGCVFSPLFESKVSGVPTEDDGKRTNRLTKLSIEVDGYVTMPTGASNISPTMQTLYRLLTARGGALNYQGRGFDISVIGASPSKRDLAWGPVPEMLDFQPLGGGLSAKIKWRVIVYTSFIPAGAGFTASWGKIPPQVRDRLTSNLLQFNFDNKIRYGEDGYSSISMHGTLEMPMTRVPGQTSRNLTSTADDLRPLIYQLATRGIDLSRFRITAREFNLSRDKRTITWEYAAEEKPYMDLPVDCTIARGTFNCKPSRTGPGLCLWVCSLNATYTVRADAPRRRAWEAFLALLRLRMSQSQRSNTPPLRPQLQNQIMELFGERAGENFTGARRAILIDFSFSEGLYLDSKITTFTASWRLCTTFSHILISSGLWTKLRERDSDGRNLWATSVSDISRESSWLSNRVDPAFAAIVDFGS